MAHIPLTTAQVIAELRLREADVSPEARRAAARAAAVWMTPQQRNAIAERNSALYDQAAHKMKIADFLMQRSAVTAAETRAAGHGDNGTFPTSCPRCGTEIRGRTNHARQDWLISHYNERHGGYR